jgi:hypothetical protein
MYVMCVENRFCGALPSIFTRFISPASMMAARSIHLLTVYILRAATPPFSFFTDNLSADPHVYTCHSHDLSLSPRYLA